MSFHLLIQKEKEKKETRPSIPYLTTFSFHHPNCIINQLPPFSTLLLKFFISPHQKPGTVHSLKFIRNNGYCEKMTTIKTKSTSTNLVKLFRDKYIIADTRRRFTQWTFLNKLFTAKNETSINIIILFKNICRDVICFDKKS